ncbi:MAG: hypothetical protein GQ569_00565 [Methylococcaceae bacterium]|nr:hypothetical protein [Methylococcaceae bacterium]
MRKIKWAVIIIVLIWAGNHPNTKALIVGLRSAFIDAPLRNAKKEAKKELETKAREREEARAREIDKSLKEMGI